MQPVDMPSYADAFSKFNRPPQKHTTMQNSEITELVNQLEQARQRYEDIGECFVETRSQYYNEISLYGDAWVGARDQLDRVYQAFGEAEETYRSLQAKLPPLQGCEEKKRWEHEEVPF